MPAAGRTAGRSSSTSPLGPITSRPSGRDRSTSVNSPSSSDAAASAACGASGTMGMPSGPSSTNGLSSASRRAACGAAGVPAAAGPGVRTARGISGTGRCTASSSSGRRTTTSGSAFTADSTAGVSADRLAGLSPGFPTDSAATAAASPAASDGCPCACTTLCLTISTILPLLSTMTLPARLTLLMKLRLMNTPVRIQQPSSRINVPSTPICVRSSAAVSMPKAPPHPVELQRLHLSEKAKPSVSEPRIRMRKSERIEWLNSSGRWRMTRTPTSTTITGIRMPDTPNELSTSRRPSLAPAQPQRFPGSTPSVARSSGESSSPLWSAAQVKNENSTAEAANTPMKSSSNPATQRALSLLERWTFCRPLGDEDVFLDAICVALDFYQAKLRIFFDISEPAPTLLKPEPYPAGIIANKSLSSHTFQQAAARMGRPALRTAPANTPRLRDI